MEKLEIYFPFYKYKMENINDTSTYIIKINMSELSDNIIKYYISNNDIVNFNNVIQNLLPNINITEKSNTSFMRKRL